MKTRYFQRLIRILCFTFYFLSLTHCASSQGQQGSSDVRLASAYDLTSLGAAVQQGFNESTHETLKVQASLASIEDLKAGRADAVLLGREPTAEELNGLKEQVIAYDAVCLLVDERTYLGGVQQYDQQPIQPLSKFAGLREFDKRQLQEFITRLLRQNKEAWFLPGYAFYQFQAYTDESGGLVHDKDAPDHILGMWVWNPVDLGGEMTQPGKFDTQAFLLQKLGFQPSDMNNPKIDILNPYFDSEEELISYRYADFLNKAKVMETPTSWVPFNFYVLIASRRVTVRAIQHGFPVRAISIETVDPLNDPNMIYDGSYLLSRKIYLLTSQNPSPGVEALAQYLISPASQEQIAKSDFLPLPAGLTPTVSNVHGKDVNHGN